MESLEKALCSFLHICFVANIKYPVGSGMLCKFLQRCVAILDENGTTAGIAKKDMASPLDKAFKPFRKILDEFCSPKNHLKIQSIYLNVFGEYAERIYAYVEKTQRACPRVLFYAKRHKSVYISVNKNMNLKKFILSIYTVWDGLSLKTISRYCPFKQKVTGTFLPLVLASAGL
jgi:hypothetical protein